MAASSIVNLIMLPLLLLLLLLGSSFTSTMATRKLDSLVESPPLALHYHNGALLAGKISVNLIWYGDFTATQRGIVTDFLSSLHPSSTSGNPSVSAWWKTTEKYRTGVPSRRRLSLVLGQQVFDSGYSLGKSLSDGKIVELAARGGQRDCINVVLTAADVTVNRFCMDRCGSHGASRVVGGKKGRFAYVWVGNSETQCPGMCAWPFHQPVYGPQEPPLVAPNGDVGVDGMIISLAGMMAGAATNTFGDGYFQGPAEAPLEAATACPGVYGTGAFPGYTGKLLVDDATSGSYNANGENGRKFLLPALWDPSSSTCYTLI